MDWIRFWILSVGWWLDYLVTRSPQLKTEMGTQDGDVPCRGGETGKTLILHRGIQLFFLGMVVYNAIENSTFSIFEMVGLGMMGIGFILRKRCFDQLGRHFTFGLGIRKDHLLIRTGMYSHLVHPSYTAQMMVHFPFWAILLLGQNWGMLILFWGLILIFFLGLRKRTRLEEAMMQDHFGIEYTQYLGQRYRLIPYIY